MTHSRTRSTIIINNKIYVLFQLVYIQIENIHNEISLEIEVFQT